MSRLKVLGGKSQHSPALSDISTIGDIPSRTMLAPCVMEWPTNEREDLAPPLFIRQNEANRSFQETIFDVWQCRCTRPGASRSFHRPNRKDFPVNNEQIIRRAYELAEKVDVKGWVE